MSNGRLADGGPAAYHVAVDLYRKAEARLKRETGRVAVDRAAAVRFALAFPNVYRVAMASLGFHLVHRMLNELPDASCERVFLPDPADLREHIRTSTQIFTLESLSPLSEFDVLGFSIAYEMDYVNVLRMLRLASLPVMTVERDEMHPLVVAGGPCATFNPEPMADFIDAFVIGDAEEVLPGLVSALRDALGSPRHEQLGRLTQVSGVYVPRFYEPRYRDSGEIEEIVVREPAPKVVRRAVTRELRRYPGDSLTGTAEAEFGHLTLVEIARGCARGCRFCAAGHINRPVRFREVVPAAQGERLGLVGAAVFDHPDAEQICRSIVEAGGEFTVSSVRLETVTPELARLLAAGGQKTLAIAPEAGTDRLRRLINKPATDEQVFAAVSAASEAGLRRVKLYSMIGLPSETDEDVEAIALLVSGLRTAFADIEFQVSVSSFVPKPWTPFQWCEMETETVLKRRFALLERRIGKLGGVSFSGETPREAAIQGILARGDRRVSKLILAALESDGDYPAAVRESAIDPAFYLYRRRRFEEVLPWEHIDVGISKTALWAEHRNALPDV